MNNFVDVDLISVGGKFLVWFYHGKTGSVTMVIPWLPRYYHGYEITVYGFTMVITMVLGWF